MPSSTHAKPKRSATFHRLLHGRDIGRSFFLRVEGPVDSENYSYGLYSYGSSRLRERDNRLKGHVALLATYRDALPALFSRHGSP